MVEMGRSGSSSQRHMSNWQIQQLVKKMKRSTKWLPKIEQVAEQSSTKEKETAEHQLETFLNS